MTAAGLPSEQKLRSHIHIGYDSKVDIYCDVSVRNYMKGCWLWRWVWVYFTKRSALHSRLTLFSCIFINLSYIPLAQSSVLFIVPLMERNEIPNEKCSRLILHFTGFKWNISYSDPSMQIALWSPSRENLTSRNLHDVFCVRRI
jgi:hypothetical protein